MEKDNKCQTPGFEERQAFRVFLEYIRDNNKKIDIFNWEELQKLENNALQETKRWKEVTKKNLELVGRGANFTESVLYHCIGCAKMIEYMMALENENGTGCLLDSEILLIAGMIHDVTEALEDDVGTNVKTNDETNSEDEAFELIIFGYPAEMKKRYRRAYEIATEKRRVKYENIPFSGISRNGRFFAAVEILLYFARAVHEVERGYKAFGDVFYLNTVPAMVFREEFYSFRVLFDPILPIIGKFIKEVHYSEIDCRPKK